MTRPSDRLNTLTLPNSSLPPPELLEHQSRRLAGIRSRLLRNAQIATRRSVLDLGAGSGAVTGELVRRASGRVIALDCQHTALAHSTAAFSKATRVCGNASQLPFADRQFDCVFSQFALIWMGWQSAVAEVFRVLDSGGVLVAIEPDYQGMIEFPESIVTKPFWEVGLRRAGADPAIGRKLPSFLVTLGFRVRVELVSRLTQPDDDRLELLRGLPLTQAECEQLRQIEEWNAKLTEPWSRVAHLPLFLISAMKPDA